MNKIEGVGWQYQILPICNNENIVVLVERKPYWSMEDNERIAIDTHN
jgi:hypothetical protein